jgi:LmbE family N-acetylglucosaminyl deacetylase
VTTIVFVHAHPDDETTQTSGSMARASAQGDRVVVVYATNGDHGDAPDDLAEGETVVDRRRAEAEASARATGTQQVEWLGYADSGMTGWEQNGAPGALHGADIEDVARRVAAILDAEDADVLVGYDWHGNYGHPDHVKVHHVAHRAAELAARRPRLLESTMNRTGMARDRQARLDRGEEVDWDPEAPMDDGNPLGSTEDEITWVVDVSDYIEQRRGAARAHASQEDTRWMRTMPDDEFARMFGAEFYIEPGVDHRMQPGWPFTANGSAR